MKGHVFRIFTCGILIAGLLSPRAAHAQKRGPSTPEERARAVKIARELEEDPLGKDAKAHRKWVVQWIIEIPDITVTECSEYFGRPPGSTRAHAEEIVYQMDISSAAFMIEHPDKAKDEQAVATAGLLGSLKAYESILKSEPDSRWPYLDKLVRTRNEGKLDDYVSETRRKCAQDEEEPDPDTIRAQAKLM